MIARELINSLTEDELGFILYLLNTYYKSSLEIDKAMLASYKPAVLIERIKESKDKVNDEGMTIYRGICNKFGIED